eukprot:CAMPEP_0194192312 /NCGR_PEP_ID=MMETSP0154-20130528/70084_1 /TAXON_ID=1049557 /ORGANISM="Thalassiothrix antarctica, Strain L6-D1" /LENGTH=426 /DNA_ID=CAMNT_0038915635 /DNA_START=49 /DNA_END=1326 /DNA_ORIENTATION=-
MSTAIVVYQGDNNIETSKRKVESIDAASRGSKKKVSEASTVNEYVAAKKEELKLSILELQTQLDMLETLEKQSDKEKLDLIIAIIDKDNSGIINAVELTDFIRRQSVGISYFDTIDTAIDYVARNDKDLSGELNREEFKRFLDLFCTELGSTFHEMCELILINIKDSKSGNTVEDEYIGKIASKQIKNTVQQKGEFHAACKDTRMSSLFFAFDMDKDGFVNFQEAAKGINKIMMYDNDDMKERAREVFELLLMYDPNGDRNLSYEEFVRLMLQVCVLKEKKWDELADDFVLAMVMNPDTVSEDYLTELAVKEENYKKKVESIASTKKAEDIMNALQYQKMQKLFDIIDNSSDNDQMLSYEELALFFEKYRRTVTTEVVIESGDNISKLPDKHLRGAKALLIEFDKDENQKLDMEEFALVTGEYAAE